MDVITPFRFILVHAIQYIIFSYHSSLTTHHSPLTISPLVPSFPHHSFFILGADLSQDAEKAMSDVQRTKLKEMREEARNLSEK